MPVPGQARVNGALYAFSAECEAFTELKIAKKTRQLESIQPGSETGSGSIFDLGQVGDLENRL